MKAYFYWTAISLVCFIVGIILEYQRSHDNKFWISKGRPLRGSVNYNESSFPGGGILYRGHFREQNNDTYVTYMFFVLFYLPIFPLLCIRTKYHGKTYDNKKEYIAYCEENSNIIEILSIYLQSWGGISFIISLIPILG